MMLTQKKELTEKVSQILNDTIELEIYVPFIVYDPMHFFCLFLEPFYFSLQLQYPYIIPGDLVALLIID